MDVRCRIEMLGGLRVRQGTESDPRVITRFRTQKTAALLAYLAFHRQRAHPREALIELLWPELDQDAGRNNLSTALSSLRHQLEPPGVPQGAVIVADRFSVRLNPDAFTTDVREMETALAEAARTRETDERLSSLTGAVQLYAGELLPGHYEEWVLTERERLAGTYHRALDQLIAHLEEAEDLDRALDYARRAVSADPLREGSHQHLIRLLAAAGESTAALRQYRELERLLDEELGETPGPATRCLVQRIEAAATQPAPPRRQREAKSTHARAPQAQRPVAPPSGTVTFLLTDIEGSTRQWEQAGEVFSSALARHHRLLRRGFIRFSGYEVKDTGDGFIVAFGRAGDALACAVALQKALTEPRGRRDGETEGPRDGETPAGDATPADAPRVSVPFMPESLSLSVRMALHTGDVELEGGDYRGLAVNHAARLLAAAHGGQVICSAATQAVLTSGALQAVEAGTALSDLGLYRLRGIEEPQRLYQVEWPGMPRRDFPALNAEPAHRAHLPLQLTRFFGREAELADLERRLVEEGTRLLTLTGPGGTGKTRLAIELAARVAKRFGGAVWFVPLADLSDPALIPGAIVDALGVPRSPTQQPLEQAVERLQRQPSLLVLDNFEHLVEDGAGTVAALLERVPSLTVLVTSRQRLDVAGEREFPVPALPTPRGSDTPEALSMYDSVRLFVDRAQAVKPDFQVTAHNAPAVAELCDRLEGMPLAIELAAARVQMLTPAQMLGQLSRRFEFLVSRRRDAPERQRTLRGAIDWSYRLLPPGLQRFFTRLSVFRGGWTLEAAEAICEEPLALDYLAQLRDMSLVQSEDTPLGMRFRMLETLREYAGEQLSAGERLANSELHAAHFLEMAKELGPLLYSSIATDKRAASERLEADHDNLRAASDWYAHHPGDGESGLRLTHELARFRWVRGYGPESYQAMKRAMDQAPDAPALLRAQVYKAMAYCPIPRPIREELTEKAIHYARIAGDRGEEGWILTIARRSEEALAVFQELNDATGMAFSLGGLFEKAVSRGEYATARALYGQIEAVGHVDSAPVGLGQVMYRQGEYEQAREIHERSLRECIESGHTVNVAWSKLNLADVALAEGDLERARALYQEGLVTYREAGHRNAGWALRGLGNVCLREGDLSTARVLGEESLTWYQRFESPVGVAEVKCFLGRVAVAQRDYAIAVRLHHEALLTARDETNRPLVTECLESLAEVALGIGNHARGARLWGAAQALREFMGAPVPPVDEHRHAEITSGLRDALGEAAFAEAWEGGHGMTWDQAVAYALEEDGA